MKREGILGTAGHIDHGKTALVRALTGVDCDRLPEEKARGITIDIGFAKLDLGDVQLGIVDVPGHERFIRNMLAGASGIDLVLFIVAADDGIMPQTREHLEILNLLQIRQGVVALTKSDLVDEATLDLREMELRDLLAGSFLGEAAIIRVSAVTGRGLESLQAAILQSCTDLGQQDDGFPFRMAIDRAFTIPGHGTVVSGSVSSGLLKIGDELDLMPEGRRVRVRSLQNHDQPVNKVRAGMRSAINLAGVSLDEVERGQELAEPGYLIPTKVLTVQLNALSENRHLIKHRVEARLHIGTAEVIATVSLLAGDALVPASNGLAQLFLMESVSAIWGQPFVLRNSSAEWTIGGGTVLQPTTTKIRRGNAEVIGRLASVVAGEELERVDFAVWTAGFAGCRAMDLTRGAGISPDRAAELLSKMSNWISIPFDPKDGYPRYLHNDRRAELAERLMNSLGALHREYPLLTVHDRSKVLARFAHMQDDALIQSALDDLLKNRKLVGDSRAVARADFKPKLSINQRKLKDFIVESHGQARFQPPEPIKFKPQAGGNAASLGEIFEVAVAEGLLVRITEEIHLHADAEAEMCRLVGERLLSGPGATVAEIRDLLGTTRKYAVPLCEYLDRKGVTVRTGDLRVLLPSPSGREAGVRLGTENQIGHSS